METPTSDMNETLITLTSDIVAAHVSNNSVNAQELGALIGSSRRASEWIGPTLEFIRPLPASAVMPLAIALFGLSGGMVLAVVAFGAMWPVLLATLHGLTHVHKQLREVSPSQGIMLETTAERLCGPGGPHEHAPDKALLQQVWKRSHALGFYGMTLPQKMGGLGLSTLDHVLVKEAIYASGSPFAPHVFGELSGPPRVGALARTLGDAASDRLVRGRRAERRPCRNHALCPRR